MAEYRHEDYAQEFRSRAGGEWTDVVRYAQGLGPAPSRPYQVEVHPSLLGEQSCRMRCVDCHGQFLRHRDGLPIEVYEDLLDDLRSMGVPSLVLSGAYSDPTVNEKFLLRLLELTASTWGVKLHCYGYGLDEELREALIKAAAVDPRRESYVTLSKVTTNPYIYQQMCHPPPPAQDSLEREQENLSALFDLVERERSSLSVRLNCRVTQLNGDPRHLAELLRWFGRTPRHVKLRFTSDYMPSDAPVDYQERFLDYVYLSPGIARQAVQTAMTIAGFKDLDRISFRDPETSEYDGDRCYNSLLFSAVSTGGFVFPCQGIAGKRTGIAYGDLRVERFPDIWRKYVARWPRLHASRATCPRCVGSCEKQINVAIGKEITTDGD